MFRDCHERHEQTANGSEKRRLCGPGRTNEPLCNDTRAYRYKAIQSRHHTEYAAHM
jgi:hypothetical protein